MEPGHIPDMGHGVILQLAWRHGLPEPRRLIGGIKYDKKKNLPLIAWRCTRCGLVELYAGGD